MRVADLELIFIPETGPVSPDHWIARWSAKLSTARLVAAVDPLATPAGLIAAARLAERPALLIGHSTGAIAAALAAEALARPDVRGAFLVAPPADDTLATLDGGLWPADPARAAAVAGGAGGQPHRPLVVRIAQSLALASDWGADFVDAGEAGRIDADSGHGPWPDGLLKLGGVAEEAGVIRDLARLLRRGFARLASATAVAVVALEGFAMPPALPDEAVIATLPRGRGADALCRSRGGGSGGACRSPSARRGSR